MIIEILKENKFKIGFIYSLLIIQYALFALIPFLLGKAIDGLLQKDNTNLIYFLVAEISALFIGFFLKRYDTKVFMEIFAAKAIKAIQILRDKNVLPAKIAARYQLVGNYSDFFEFSSTNNKRLFIGWNSTCYAFFCRYENRLHGNHIVHVHDIYKQIL